MPTAAYRVYFDSTPAERERLDQFGEIRVDQAIGMTTEAELRLPVATDDGGRWSGQEEELVQPFRRVRIEVRVGEDGFVPLIDGPVIAHRFELKARPGQSNMTLVVHDDSVLLNRDEKVAVFEDMATDEIAKSLIEEHGLTPQVDQTPASGAAFTRFVVQRGTNMQLLRQLARQYGMWTYVRPGPRPGQSVGVFSRPSFAPSDLPKIVLLGPDRNVGSLSVAFDALRPFKAEAASIAIADRKVLTARAETMDLAPLGAEAVHEAVAPTGTALLAHTREEQSDIDAATQAAVDLSAWALSAEGEINVDRYSGVIRAYQVVRAVGVGGFLSGDYVVSRVTHRLNSAGYRQQFALARNARSAGTGGRPGIPGGLS
jgi:phage protein D